MCVESRRVCICVHNCSVCTVHVCTFMYMCMLCLCVSVCGRDRANVLLLGYRSPLALPRFAACNLSVKTIKQKLTFLNAE